MEQELSARAAPKHELLDRESPLPSFECISAFPVGGNSVAKLFGVVFGAAGTGQPPWPR